MTRRRIPLGLMALLLSFSCTGLPTRPAGTGKSSGPASPGAFNRPPVLRVIAANPAPSASLGTPFTFLADASDPDSDVLTYAWTTTGGSFDSPNAARVVWTPPTEPGLYQAQVTVTDGRGGRATLVQPVTVTLDKVMLGEAAPGPDIPVTLTSTAPLVLPSAAVSLPPTVLASAMPSAPPSTLPITSPTPEVEPSEGLPTDYSALRAFDGDPTTRWSSRSSDPQWLRVDLGNPTAISQVKLTWSDCFATRYTVQASSDRATWKTVVTVTAGDGSEDVHDFAPVQARYIRVLGTERIYNAGYGLIEFKVSGAATGADLAANKPARASSVEFDALRVYNAQNALLDVPAADAHYKAGRYVAAKTAYQALWDAHHEVWDERSPLERDEVKMRLFAVDYRLKDPEASAAKAFHATMFVVPETDASVPTSRTNATPIAVPQMLDEAQVPKVEDGFYWFSEGLLGLTDGKMHWQLTTQRVENGKITSLFPIWDTAYDRLLARPRGYDPGFASHLTDDMFVLLWPGTAPHPTAFTMYGGASEVTVGAKSRMLLYTEGDAYDLYLNSPRYFMHEFFHEVEKYYPDVANWPKYGSGAVHTGGHPYEDRTKWPSDYTGTTEFDFYEQTYRKRVLPVDNLTRMDLSGP